MDGWLSKDLETLNAIQEKFCNDNRCQKCYFKDFTTCLGEAMLNIKGSYEQLEHVYTVFINKMKEHF